MERRLRCGRWLLAAAAAVLAAGSAGAQVSHLPRPPLSANVIIPQSRVVGTPGAQVVRVTGVDVGAVIVEQTATTTMDISLFNPTGSRLEAELIVAVPARAAIRSFTFQGAGSEPTAELLPKEEADRIYRDIVAKMRDPALLEFLGLNLVRSCVFPVPPNGAQKLRLTYEHILEADGDRVDYILPRTESLDYSVPWNVTVKITASRPISTVYSPSHRIESVSMAKNAVSVRMAPDASRDPGSFRLAYLLDRGEVSATMLAYPDPKAGGGYFLLLASPPSATKGARRAIPREVTLVIDRSGSMAGLKLAQARKAALQVLGSLDDGEAFNIILYNEGVDRFADAPVVKSEETFEAARKYLLAIQANGGTNIHDALLDALQPKPREGMLPMVLFLTDGLPTVGQTSESAIRAVASDANPHKRRVFTFGVGVDVNTPLLDAVAGDTRGCATYVLESEDVEVKVSGVFKRLSGPVLADTTLRVELPDGRPAPFATMDVVPARLPDLFDGDQLVLLGKYTAAAPSLTFIVSGNYLGRPRAFRFSFTFDKANVQNAFVPRLWATRKVAVLVDAVRRMGADGPAKPPGWDARSDPRFKELVDEIVRLSTEFGILTEYTAFLAREGTDLARHDSVMEQASANFDARAVHERSGLGSAGQSVNHEGRRKQASLNYRNSYYDEKMNRVEVSAVQQVNDRAFFQRGNRWVDSRVAARSAEAKADREIAVGSEEHAKLAERLSREGRAGAVSLKGEILMEVDGQTVLVK